MSEGITAREITITRVFDAPRELVWKAWTEPERLAQWWGKRGWTARLSTIQTTDENRAATEAGLASAFERLAEHLEWR